MNTRGLLDQLLKSWQELMQNKGLTQQGGGQGAQGGKGGLDLGSLLSGAGGGALAAGALGLLMGSKKARKVGGKVVAYGGLAALGVLAYKPTATGSRSRPALRAASRRPLTACRRHRSSSIATRSCGPSSPPRKPTDISMIANAN